MQDARRERIRDIPMTSSAFALYEGTDVSYSNLNLYVSHEVFAQVTSCVCANRVIRGVLTLPELLRVLS